MQERVTAEAGRKYRPQPAHGHRQRPIRNLLEGADNEVALDGYVKAAGDIVDWPPGSFFAHNAQDCAECIRAARAG